jgi:citrate lyase beta subunit
VLRINGVDTQWHVDDLELANELELDAIVLPKANPDAVVELGPDGPPLIAIVETADGLRRAFETAELPRVELLLLGAADLGAELRLEPRPDGLEILYARSKVVNDSAAAGIRAPLDVVHLDIRDLSGLEASARFARSLGFGGKACIHPDQVDVVNEVFTPEDGDVAWARKVVAAFEQGERDGRGAVELEGTMVDLPVVERARQVLAAAQRGGAREH